MLKPSNVRISGVPKTNMKKDTNGEVTPVNKWRCETCDSEDMTPEQMKNHLHNKHGIKTEGLKANRSMISHVDGDTWFSWNWRWTFQSAKGAVSMEQYTLNRRAKDDMMRYA